MNKHDAPRIAIVNINEAVIYYRDGSTINLHSDSDVRRIIEIVLLPMNFIGDFQTYTKSMDDTISLVIK